MKLASLACLTAGFLLVAAPGVAAADPPLDLERATVAELQTKMAAGQLTSVQATRAYSGRGAPPGGGRVVRGGPRSSEEPPGGHTRGLGAVHVGWREEPALVLGNQDQTLDRRVFRGT
jgi:hypothetical protein